VNDKEIIRALNAVVKVEAMAVQIYRAQMWRFQGRREIAERLVHATAVERRHFDELASRVRELGGTPSRLSPLFAVAGWIIGFLPTLAGKMPALKLDIWVEERAVRDYQSFLDGVSFDDESRALMEKNMADEKEHIRAWEESIELLRR
jgi:bacterioferritin